MAARLAFESFVILALLSGCFSVDPCKDYDFMWMDNGRRSSDFNSWDIPTTSICDAYLTAGTWYRFEHDAGDRLIERTVEPWYCGTQAPIWLNGTHPTDTTEVTAQVCATYNSTNVCGWKGTVRIRLCNVSVSEYFVYLLAVPPGCALAYCVDAASRKQCIPPDVWLPDEFKCGEHKTTPIPPIATQPSPAEPLSSGWSTWGPWSDCSKPCDYGLQMRRRTCGQLPCTGDATSSQLCALSNCEELQEENDKGIVLFLQSAHALQDTMLKVVESQQKIHALLRVNINIICSHDVSLCCGFTIKSISSDLIEYVTSNDIYAAKGFPKSKSGIVHYKIIAIINEAVNKATCISESINITANRQVQSTDFNFIPFEVMNAAARNMASRILQETGLVVTAYIDPEAYHAAQDDDSCPTATCIVPIVVCCTVIAVVALGLIIGCSTIHTMKKTKTEPESEKKTDFAESSMVHPILNSVQTEMEKQPEMENQPEKSMPAVCSI